MKCFDQVPFDSFYCACVHRLLPELFAEPHVGSKLVGELIAENDANGDAMELITQASIELAAHCLAREEGLGPKANQQQRWLDLALSLKASAQARTDDIESAQVISC